MNTSFLTEETAFLEFTNFDVKIDNLTHQDSYNEILLKEKIAKEPLENQRELQVVAAHVAIVGVGKKTFGKVVLNGVDVDVEKLIKKHKIKLNQEGANLKEDDLTLRRLTRIYRYHIKKFLELYDCSSYLFRKYSNHEKEFRAICFSGAEHLVETEREIKFLRNVYKKMDDTLGTNFINRFDRIIIARGFGEKLN